MSTKNNAIIEQILTTLGGDAGNEIGEDVADMCAVAKRLAELKQRKSSKANCKRVLTRAFPLLPHEDAASIIHNFLLPTPAVQSSGGNGPDCTTECDVYDAAVAVSDAVDAQAAAARSVAMAAEQVEQAALTVKNDCLNPPP
jgi:hypothetical protein